MDAGKIIIETELATENFEKTYKDLERKAKRNQTKLEELNEQKVKFETDIQEFEKEKKEFDELTQKAKEYNAEVKKIQAQRKQIQKEAHEKGQLLSYIPLQEEERVARKQLAGVQRQRFSAFTTGMDENAYQEAKTSLTGINQQIQSIETEQESITNNMQAMNVEIQKAKQIEDINTSINKMGTGIKKAVTHVSRWMIGLFGVRSAYNAIRSAMSVITQYDTQLATDIQYMKNALAFTLEPIVRTIINLVKTLLRDIQLAVYYLTGKNIFANANKSLQQAVGSAKELKKQLAGFDEMNVLSDQSSSGGGGAGTPSMDLTEIDNNSTKLERFGKLLKIIGTVLTWLGIVAKNLALGITGVVLLITGVIIENWDKIKAFLQKGIDWLSSKSDWIHEHLGDTVGRIYDFIVQTLQDLLNWFDVVVVNIEKIFNGIITFIKGVFTGNWKQAWEGIKSIFIGIWNIIKSTFVTVFNFIKNLVITVGTTVGNIIAGAFKAVVNGVLIAIEKILNFPIKAINKLIKKINKVPGINLTKLETFNLPRLAKGGIVNMPGKGVPVGGALAGERRMEGVIPLTDSQQMSLLGEAIGKYITVNANITNTMNGRVISRELQKVQNNSDFAYNR